MATQRCPACTKDAFTWRVDDGHPETVWQCHSCGYTAREQENGEQPCAACGLQAAIRLYDADAVFEWCSACNRIVIR